MVAITMFPSIATVAGGALIASPNGAFRDRVVDRLQGRCRPVQQVQGGADALAKLEKGDWQMLFLDRRVSDLDTEELIEIIQKRFPGIQVVLLDSHAEFCPDAAERKTERENENGKNNLVNNNFGNKDSEQERESDQDQDKDVDKDKDKDKDKMRGKCEPLPGMIGASDAMRRMYRLARLVAGRSTTVLIAGATGSGKELVAQALHQLSPRAGRAFIAVNCAAIPEALLESELFGHTRGAFTGAVQAQLGRIPAAHGGTLFLDEVSELPLGMQAKLLRFLEQKEVQRLGTAETTRVDVRVIAASNVDLGERARRGEFREDLFYRLSAFPLELPTLAERRSDILPLAEHFLACMAAAMHMATPRLSGEAMRILECHSWKGNVRELQHVMERASILVESGDTVLAEHLYFPFLHRDASPAIHHSCSTLAS